MKQIPLTQGRVALVDDADFDYLSQWKWYAVKSGRTFYARRANKNDGPSVLTMHQQLYGMKKVDHKDGNGLNNQRSNLRLCDVSQNRQNMVKTKRLTSIYKGVSWDKSRRKWDCRIRPPGQKQIRIGRFDSETEAAKAYDEMAIAVFGEFANTNF